MAARVPTYIPTPNWDIPANSDLVVLGRLIKDPNDPESKIPSSSHVPIPPRTVYKGRKEDWASVTEQIRRNSIGLWAKCLQWVGGGLDLHQLRAGLDAHRFDLLETMYFVPDEAYFSSVLDDPGVRAYLEVHGRRRPVYMITGLKIARVASAATRNTTERGVAAELKADATSVGVPLELGPEVSVDWAKTVGTSFARSTDYIFAYRLARIKARKDGTASENTGYVKAALFDGSGEGPGSMFELDQFDIEEETELGFEDTLETLEGEDNM